MFRIQGFTHLMPRLTQLAEIHVLDLRVTTNAFYQLARVEPQLHIECEPVPG